MAICLCPSLASHLSCFKDSALASDFALLTEELSLSSEPLPSVSLRLVPCASAVPTPVCFSPERQSGQHPSIALDTENTQHITDRVWLTLQIPRQQYSCFITTGFLELYTDRFPQDVALCLSYKSLRLALEKQASRCLWDSCSDRQHCPPFQSVSISFLCKYQLHQQMLVAQTPFLQHFRTACSPQVTQTCKGNVRNCCGIWRHLK